MMLWKHYNVIKINNNKQLILPASNKTENIKLCIVVEEMLSCLKNISIGHEVRNCMFFEISKRYKNMYSVKFPLTNTS